MLLRIRWFLLGVLGAVGGGAYVLVKLRAMRERLTPRNVGRAAAMAAADALDMVGSMVEPKSRGERPR